LAVDFQKFTPMSDFQMAALVSSLSDMEMMLRVHAGPGMPPSSQRYTGQGY
jgi:hypothetical protein